jgi:hypothetical protein
MKNRTLLTVLILLITISCNLSRRNSGIGESVVGAWEIIHMSMTPVPVDNLPESKLASGRMEFKEDGTFAGTLSMPGVTQETSVNGHYQVVGNIITIENGLNKSTTQSKMRFEKNYLVLEPITQEPSSYAMYYRRIR